MKRKSLLKEKSRKVKMVFLQITLDWTNDNFPLGRTDFLRRNCTM